ncbi:TPA: hypothetical protein DCR49_10255 [Candidatus Delongbacteria bacterium]|nr:MAG: hypothetical protein A2Y39_02565 [Candidatus Delongbacteria bacterium GWF2_40_14]HAQ62360.1 hypothetical protein [Candidatus Delongbacteria bacterium]
MINKLLPIVDPTRKMPSFYAAKNLSKNEIEDVIKLYEYILNPEIKNIKTQKEESEQLEN